MNLTAFQDFLTDDLIYSPEQLPEMMKKIRPEFRLVWSNRKQRYFDVPCAFDIETSSFYEGAEKVAVMYEWTFGIYGAVVIGRTWEQLEMFFRELAKELNLNERKRLIVYVHNLAYEFQFIRKHFRWEKVFSLKPRTPIYALTDLGIEFRCSYLLSGYSLEKVGDNLQTVKIRKLSGALDYDKVRHQETVLTDQETAYCVNDVKVVMAYVAEKQEETGNITKIPLTKTGYVRNFCRNSCFFTPGLSRREDFKRLRYMEIMNRLQLCEDEYKQLKRAFQGGFTHANAFWSGKVLSGVRSYDFTSSYPAVMIAERFPMSSAEEVEISSREEFERNLRLYCCLFDVKFYGLIPRIHTENYLSLSRCYGVRKAVVNNGRVVSAEEICSTMTEQDFMILRQFYKWSEMRVTNFRRYRKDYLPTDFVKAIITLYKNKTELKGVEGKEAEYLRSKEMLNSCYGMAVTDIVRDEILYENDDWTTEVPNMADEIRKYNRSPGRFLFYPWGVWVTAYSRRNLFTGIIEFGDDYVYSDTDSIKVLHADVHQDYIERYNATITKQLERAIAFHGLDPADIRPRTIKGVEKPLGVWDFDGEYSRFKTLGAKRYMTESAGSGKISITVSGLNKKKCVPWLLETYGADVFDAFNDDLYVPPEYTGKMTHTYIDQERSGVVTDYTGSSCAYLERSSVHLEKTDYSLSIAREYADYLRNVQDAE